MQKCLICGRILTPHPSDGEPLVDSSDCGGDCWGCVREFEPDEEESS